MAKAKAKPLVIDGYEITEGVQKSRDKVKKLLDADKLFSSVTKSGVPQLWIIEAWHTDFTVALGTVWYRFIGKAAIEIQDSKTHISFRRLGLRTWLHNDLVKGYPSIQTIFSMDGTPQGLAWMKTMGYKETAFGWQWFRPKETGRKPTK